MTWWPWRSTCQASNPSSLWLTARRPYAMPPRTDVSVRAEDVLRVEPGLDRDQPVELGAVGRAHAVVVLVGRLEVDVVAAGREGPDAPPGVAHPLREVFGARFARRPASDDPARIAGVSISHGPVVGLALVQCPTQVEDPN